FVRRIPVVFVAVAAIAPSVASASPADCITIESELDRLACYDKEAGRTPIPVTSSQAGEWRMETRKNALTDKTDVFLGVLSEDAVNCGWNRGDRIMLQVRCMEN